jgi:methionyl-tRNA formyltransferase
VLFCGADAFSIYSLRALHKLQQAHPERIASIDVVCRPDKRVGRGLKKIQEGWHISSSQNLTIKTTANTSLKVPIKQTATALSLPIHQIDTFTSWTPPTPYTPNLIVTVSFGLLVPARILKSATYGGLNIHPSLLPDLRGPAPLQHALLNRRSHTGVSLQTMHPTKFDHGVVLAQTPAPGVPIGEADTPQSLLETLGPLGAEMLVRGISEKLFIPPYHDTSETLPTSTSTQPSHAPKISPSDREINWKTWSSSEILLRDRVLGRLWDGSIWARTNLDAGKWEGKQKNLRATFTGPWRVASAPEGVEAGTPFLCTKAATGAEEIRFATRDGKAVVPAGMTQESGRKDQGLGLLVEQIKEQEE